MNIVFIIFMYTCIEICINFSVSSQNTSIHTLYHRDFTVTLFYRFHKTTLDQQITIIIIYQKGVFVYLTAGFLFFLPSFKCLTLRLLMSCIYGAHILDVSRSHTTTHRSQYESSGRAISSSRGVLPTAVRRCV